MYRLFLAAAMLVALAAPSSAQTAAWSIDPAHSAAQFAVRHMMISNVKGEFGKISGTAEFDGKDVSTLSVQATIDATSINTRVSDRDTHLKSADFLDVAKFPTITFVSRKVQPVTAGRFKLIGDLTIRGVTREVALDVEGPTPEIKDQRGNVRIGASAATKINRKDFGVLWNRAMDSGGVVVGDEVAITIDLELTRKAAAPSQGEGG